MYSARQATEMSSDPGKGSSRRALREVSSPGCLRSSLPNVALIYMASNGGSGALPKLDLGFASSATSDPVVAKACAAGGFLGTNATDHGWSLSGVDSNDCAVKTTLVATGGSETDMSFTATRARFSLKSVLVATDFSDASRQPLGHGLAVARHYGAKFYLAHVVSGLGYTLTGPDALEAASGAAKRDLLQLEQQLVECGSLEGIEHESIVSKGVVWEELQSIISQNHIDLVVVGTHGRRGLGRIGQRRAILVYSSSSSGRCLQR